MKILKPADVTRWTGRVVDVRDPDEFARERLDGVTCECVPLSTIAAATAAWDRREPILCLCRSGARSRQAAAQLEAMGFQDVATLDGGLGACRGAGVAVVKTKAPIPIQRQVMIGAGAFVVAGLALAHLVHPAFIAVDWFVGTMLMVAGISGFCPMARILTAMPWNRPASVSVTSCAPCSEN